MSVNLQKGQKVNLRKEDGGALRRVMVGLGWDEVKQKRGFFAPKPQDIDCDASVFVCVNGHLMGTDDIVYFGNLTHKSSCIRHMGDNLTGAGEGDDEQIMVDLASMPSQYDKLVVDADNNQEMCKYNLSENYDGMTAMIFGELYRYNNEWKFNAIGQGTRDNGLGELANRFV